jgi:nucleoside-diphosphate-sugar epimerase
MHELAQAVMKVHGKNVELVKKPLPADDPKRRCPDISLAQQLLAFEPKVSVEEGIARTYADFKERVTGAK